MRGRCVGVVAAVALLAAVPALGQDWTHLSPKDRQKAQEKYEIYKRLPQSRQREIQRSYEEWQNMRPSERARIRENYKAYRDLTPQQRRAVGELYQQKRGTR